MRKAQYKGYEVSEDGTILSKRFKRPMKFNVLKTGYATVPITENGVEKRESIHRIVAKSFLPNPNNLPVVNHKDGNKLNNHVENLEWCTYSENLKHAYEIGIREAGDNSEALMSHPQPTRRKIAAMYATGNYSMEHVGRLFGIGAGTVHRYVTEFKDKEL